MTKEIPLRKINYIVLLLIALVTFASCKKEKDLPRPDTQQFQTEMSIEVLEEPPFVKKEGGDIDGLYIDKKIKKSTKNLKGRSLPIKPI